MLKKIIVLLFVGAASVCGSLHVDVTGGYSMQSAYQYYSEQPQAEGVLWLSLEPINNVCVSSRLSVDIWKKSYRFGVYGGFIRRYNLQLHSKTEDGVQTGSIGEMLSIPIIGFVEGRLPPFFFEFGIGPYITRCNYARSDLPAYSVTSLFGFLFGGGYERQLLPGWSMVVKGELLVNAPVLLVDFLAPQLKEMSRDSRYSEYNINEFQTIIFNGTISLGVQYEFGGNVRIPLDDAIAFIGKRGVYNRSKKDRGKR